MLSRAGSMLLGIAVALAATSAAGADYRGMPAGWPNMAGYAPATYGGYYAARPVTVAYANPAYLAAYGNAAYASYRPTLAAAAYYQSQAAYYAPANGAAPTAAYYAPGNGAAPTAAYYAPQSAYYAPHTAGYAPSQSYAISPAGGSSAGSEAAAYLGQPTALNYVPPRFQYRTAYASVPVYMYRPVTVYQPVAGQPTTCLQPQTMTTCQPVRQRSWFSWLHPHNWFRGSGCGSPPPTTVYCQPPCGAQPYYPVPQTPAVIQGVPAQIQGVPLQPQVITPLPAGPRVPSPPTRILPGSGGAADFQPRIQGPIGAPGSSFPTGPTTVPSTTVPSTTLPSTTTPFPSTTVPSTTVPSTPGSSFGTGTNYPPGSDPYRAAPAAPSTTIPSVPNSTIFGSGYRGPPSTPRDDGPVIRAPELNSALPPGVQAVPDLDARQPVAPLNRAPQLIAPRDKTAARGDQRWAVVPAVWPSQPSARAQRMVAQTKATEFTPPPAASARYDDSGWTSGRW